MSKFKSELVRFRKFRMHVGGDISTMSDRVVGCHFKLRRLLISQIVPPRFPILRWTAHTGIQLDVTVVSIWSGRVRRPCFVELRAAARGFTILRISQTATAVDVIPSSDVPYARLVSCIVRSQIALRRCDTVSVAQPDRSSDSLQSRFSADVNCELSRSRFLRNRLRTIEVYDLAESGGNADGSFAYEMVFVFRVNDVRNFYLKLGRVHGPFDSQSPVDDDLRAFTRVDHSRLIPCGTNYSQGG